MRYLLFQDTPEGRWQSSETYEGERRHAVQNVIAGFLPRQPRWTVDATTGAFIYGLDGKGKEIHAEPERKDGAA